MITKTKKIKSWNIWDVNRKKWDKIIEEIDIFRRDKFVYTTHLVMTKERIVTTGKKHSNIKGYNYYWKEQAL